MAEPEPVMEEPVAEASAEAAVEEPDVAPVAEEPESTADAKPAPKAPRRGFWAWLFRPRRR